MNKNGNRKNFSLWVVTRIWLKCLSTKDKKMRKKSRAMDSEWALEVMHKAPSVLLTKKASLMVYPCHSHQMMM